MEYVHPEQRSFKKYTDALLKVADILYYLKKGKYGADEALKKIRFIKPISKKMFPDKYEEISEIVDEIAEKLKQGRTDLYDEYIALLKEKYPEAIEELEKESKSSLLSFLGK